MVHAYSVTLYHESVAQAGGLVAPSKGLCRVGPSAHALSVPATARGQDNQLLVRGARCLLDNHDSTREASSGRCLKHAAFDNPDQPCVFEPLSQAVRASAISSHGYGPGAMT